MTRDQMQQLIVANTRREDKTDVINTAIDLALNEITQRHTFKNSTFEFDVPIGQGDTEATLDPSAFQLLGVRVFDGAFGYPLDLRSKAWILERFPTLVTESRGRPVFGFEDAGKLVFTPRSSGDFILRVRAFKLHADLQGDATPSIPHVSASIVAWATAWVFRSTQQYDDADKWLFEYERTFQLAMQADSRRGRTVRAEEFPPRRPVTAVPWMDPFARR